MESFHEERIKIGGVLNQGGIVYVSGVIPPKVETSLTNSGR